MTKPKSNWDQEFAAFNDEAVLEYISDDIIYLQSLVEAEKSKGLDQLNIFKQAHLARLVVVVCYNFLEGYRDWVSRKIGFTSSTSDWATFFRNSPLTYHLSHTLTSNTLGLESIEDVLDFILGLRELRNMISHGLIDASAKNFSRKAILMNKAGLLKQPMKLSIKDVDTILPKVIATLNLIGMSMGLLSAVKHK